MTIRQRLLSEANIYLSIYLLESYIQNIELLEKSDRKLFCALRDKLDGKTIGQVIETVKGHIKRVLDGSDEFFMATVWFKPKKYENGKTVFRPLHTASLHEQIAMVAMFQVLIYDISNNGKLIPSELSRLIPSDFYGNRISYDGERLFKPWREQYQAYTSTANTLLYTYSKTGEFKYEVDLDLENFFPSVDPRVIFGLINKYLPLKYSSDDLITLRTAIKKLLIFRLCPLDENELDWYYNGAPNVKGRFVKGLPQGLPHSYFFANIFMLVIKRLYNEEFKGKAVYYVDDSVIFTSEKLDDEAFEKKIANLNKKIADEETLLKGSSESQLILPYSPEEYGYGIRVHGTDGKSVYEEIAELSHNKFAPYFADIGRDASNIGFDMYSIYSDEETKILYSRTKEMRKSVENHLYALELDGEATRKKLVRYRKFYKYRETVLNYRINGNINKLKDELISDLNERSSNTNLEGFFEKYNDDILAASINFVLAKCIDENISCDDLISAIDSLDISLYGKSGKHSYIHKSNIETYQNIDKFGEPADRYGTIEKRLESRFKAIREQSAENRYKRFDTLVSMEDDELFSTLNLSDIYKYSETVRKNSDSLCRMILNGAYSYMFRYDIDDGYDFAKLDRLPIQYSELRILAALRNDETKIADFKRRYIQFTDDEYRVTTDYSILQVMSVFKTFVGDPDKIDKLILIHKYCCDTWKNGSKYLYFYTLHNQEHAIMLIKTSVTILHAVSYLKLGREDLFIFFAACYLHDISMVTMPELNSFVFADNEAVNKICSDFDKADRRDVNAEKMALLGAYQGIEQFFENEVRSKHQLNSAREIRTQKELDFLDREVRELIAVVSAGHGEDVDDIYFTKAPGQASLISEKELKILLRLSDLFDMNRYRISKLILTHNLKNINPVSRFHWISHLITDSCTIRAEYEFDDKTDRVTERLIVDVGILLSQTTSAKHGDPCCHISDCTLNPNGDDADITLICERDVLCPAQDCSFICKWFNKKNNYLILELAALNEYLTTLEDYFFVPKVEIRIKIKENALIPNEIFDYLNESVNE